MPIEDEDVFNYYWGRYLTSEKGIKMVETRMIGLDQLTGKLKYMRISAQSQGNVLDSREEKLPIRDLWDQFVEDFEQNKAPDGLKSLF